MCMAEGNGVSTDRTPTKWVVFLRDKKYVKNDKPYIEYVFKPRDFEGTVVGLSTGETKIGKKTFQTKVIVLQTEDGRRFGFNLPIGSYYYYYLTDLRKIEVNKKARIKYLGTAGSYNLPIKNDAHVIIVEPLE